MNRFAVERGAGSSGRRLWLVRAFAAIPAMSLLSALPRTVRAQSEGMKSSTVSRPSHVQNKYGNWFLVGPGGQIAIVG